jgi:acetylornithine deacetylase/succinyl-diaminopimelate desuccinylase-like protein
MLAETLTVQRIAAPTFEERARAEYVHTRFVEIGLADIAIDDIGNVYGRLPGSGQQQQPAVMVSAHLDTVFPGDTDLTLTTDKSAGRVVGPGVGDNCTGLGAMIQLAEAMAQRSMALPADVWWVATVGEEGLGDLRGMRRACDTLVGKFGLAIILEGIGLGRIYHAGMGVRRLKIAVQGPGGHSWLHAGRPSAIHQLLRLGASITDHVRPPKRPRSSLNIGLISGGTSINTIAPEATCTIDLRSVENDALTRMEAEVRDQVQAFDSIAELSIRTEVVGDRPSASLPGEHPLVRAAQASLRHVNVGPGSREIGSTDANIPLSRGIPAVCIGITTGGGAHTTEEYIDIPPLGTGMNQLTLLTLLAAHNSTSWSRWNAS